ncbi:MAG: DUF3806 domain-containing protein [Proteobacteria bacterium]|nr:DUF3806 domain-containing protein [Pseudomonadota bacterium]
MDQMIGELTAGEVDRLEKQRAWVRNHYDEDARNQYESIAGKLSVLNRIVASQWIEPNETLKLQSLGVTLGDALAQFLGLHWVAVEDEHGRDPALRDADTSLVVFPMTMISKRIERGEVVDVLALFRDACESIERLRIELENR